MLTIVAHMFGFVNTFNAYSAYYQSYIVIKQIFLSVDIRRRLPKLQKNPPILQ